MTTEPLPKPEDYSTDDELGCASARRAGGRCPARYERAGGREPGDRIVACHLEAGHPGDHEEADTEVTWVSHPLDAELVERSDPPEDDRFTEGRVQALLDVGEAMSPTGEWPVEALGQVVPAVRDLVRRINVLAEEKYALTETLALRDGELASANAQRDQARARVAYLENELEEEQAAAASIRSASSTPVSDEGDDGPHFGWSSWLAARVAAERPGEAGSKNASKEDNFDV
jgi:hypothetical protein